MGWRASLRERGYAHFVRVVPAALLEAARAAIAEDLRLRYDAAREHEYGSRTYWASTASPSTSAPCSAISTRDAGIAGSA